jgi:predicted PurR-regulated permease PerM
MSTPGPDTRRQIEPATEAGAQNPASVVGASAPSQHPHGTAELLARGVPDYAPQTGLAGRAVYPLGLSRVDIQRIIGLAVALAIIGYFLYVIQDVLPPFVIAFALAALLDPWLRRAERKGTPRWRATLLLYLSTFVIVLFLAVTVVPKIVTEIRDFSNNFNSYYNTVQARANQFLLDNSHWLKRFGVTQTKLSDIINQNSGPIKATFTTILTGITGFVTGIASHAIWFIIIPISGFFFMRDFPFLRARIIALFPEPFHQRIDKVSNEVVDVFSSYVRGLGKICLLYAVTASIVFWILGLRYFLFLGLLAGLFYAVPIAGQFVTATVSGAVAYTMDAHNALFFIHVPSNSVGYAVLAIVSVVVMNNIFDQLIYPRVVGGSVGLHPVTAIFALAAGATLLGVWGMVLAVPVAASIQIILMYSFPKLRQPAPAELVRGGIQPATDAGAQE